MEQQTRPTPVASYGHTAILALILIAIAVAGTVHPIALHPGTNRPSLIPAYVALLLFECALLYGVWRGISSRGVTLGDLAGGKWNSPKAIAIDVGLGILLWSAVALISSALTTVMGTGAPSGGRALLPDGLAETTLFVAVSVVGGFVEEIAFRGYFQRQFWALTANPWAAIILQALLFGIIHGYQGLRATGGIAIYGVLFGALAYWRRSLRPGILAHIGTDAFAGLFARYFLH